MIEERGEDRGSGKQATEDAAEAAHTREARIDRHESSGQPTLEQNEPSSKSKFLYSVLIKDW